MILAHAACTHAAEGQVAAGEMVERIIDADAASHDAAEHHFNLCRVVAETVKGQRTIKFQNKTDRIVEQAIADDWQKRAENLLLHDRIVGAGSSTSAGAIDRD